VGSTTRAALLSSAAGRVASRTRTAGPLSALARGSTSASASTNATIIGSFAAGTSGRCIAEASLQHLADGLQHEADGALTQASGRVVG
jgi:hypothetical protein